ncbi:MAG: hypothetical protein O7C59_09910 [Rickettsia endosymbiont of Ixodes persulcatus]|nr:hypothetical protein [Rickettsia endosymbiont of Ixodes persulcatus]MCZ6914721.1 hypothetical protein [Rickettsia endosymbiont of Ixodes persulcatus]MCZ6924669.1 hypothetical protein [Rickettsia endosymbiont of Ixodes persulcatus]
MVEQFWANPEKFCRLNVEYIDKLRELTANSFANFVCSPAKAVFSPDNRDKRLKILHGRIMLILTLLNNITCFLRNGLRRI